MWLNWPNCANDTRHVQKFVRVSETLGEINPFLEKTALNKNKAAICCVEDVQQSDLLKVLDILELFAAKSYDGGTRTGQASGQTMASTEYGCR